MVFLSEATLSLKTVEGLVELSRSLGRTSDLQTVLDIVCRALVDVAQFEVATINLLVDAVNMKVVAVAGPPELGEKLLGVVAPRQQWVTEMAESVRHHGLLLSKEVDDSRLVESWTSDDEAWFARTADHADAWKPDYALFVPMHDSFGEMIGVVSVDLPASGLIPDAAQSATVEIVARQAETAIAAARRVARSALNERVYRLAFEAAPTLTAIAEVGGVFVDANLAFQDAFPGVADARAFDRAVTVHDGKPGLSSAIERIFAGGLPALTFVAESTAPAGARWFRVTVRGIGQADAVPERAVCTIVDITIERSEQLRHRRDAEHDPLTGLLNRRGARGAMETLVDRLRPESVVAVLAGDLDGFKGINDQFGHQVGDDVLVVAAERMAAALPDRGLAIRLGGDEFLLVAECPTREGAEQIAGAVVAAMRCPVVVDGQVVPVTISIGLATADSGRDEGLSGLVDAADQALYNAKHAGRSRWVGAAHTVA